MFIIFGTRGRVSNSSDGEVLHHACPRCSCDLESKDLKQWFTLFFIPIFPVNTIESFYQCNGCGATYTKSAKQEILDASKDRDQLELEAKLRYSKTLIACMTHMAKIDGSISPEEQNEIDYIKSEYTEFKDELEEVYSSVVNAENAEEYVYDMLRESSQTLTKKSIMSIISKSAEVLMADGNIDKEEENLLKEYLLVCGIPKSMYNTVMDNMYQES